MSLQPQLDEITSGFLKKAPEDAKEILMSAKAGIQEQFDPKTAIQAGDAFPDFALSNALGEPVSKDSLLEKGPILLQLVHLQKYIAEFAAKGVTLVAISPELPDTSLTEGEKRGLTFPVLSDVGNVLAHKLGIVWKQPDSLRPVFAQFGHDLLKRNGDDSLEVPIPATILVDKNGVVQNMYIEADYAKRLEPETALAWVDKL